MSLPAISIPDQPVPPSTSTKKPRRAKPHIELAPDQPLTTQGKPRARVYVACLQWYGFFLLTIPLRVLTRI